MDDIKDMGLDEMTQRVSKHKKKDLVSCLFGEMMEPEKKTEKWIISEEENPKCGPVLDVK